MWIDLSADVGEGLGDVDRDIMAFITSANIACGGHAGDIETMRATVTLALSHGVSVGAHPGYPDRDGFGRREIDIDDDDLRASLWHQLDALDAVVAGCGGRIGHVKPHGALYNRAAVDDHVARLVADVVRTWRADAALIAPPRSRSLEAATAVGSPALAEGFADRAYEPDGRLRPRSRAGAVLLDPRQAAAQAVTIARDGRAPLEGGGWVGVPADTLCLHGDAPGAVERVAAVRAALGEAGITLRAPRSA